MRKKIISILVIAFLLPVLIRAQVPELKIKLNDDGKYYIKATFLNQTWMRYNQSNPGTTVLGQKADETFDIGLRRTRMQLFGQLSDRLFFYTQFGSNNFNFLSQNAGNRKLMAFFHDALGEFNVITGENPLKIGAGLTICGGLSRFTMPSVGTIMTLDVPVFAQTTVDQTDEFARKMSLYARGQAGKLDYRFALSDPFPINTNGAAQPVLNSDATFATMGHHLQYQTFLSWNFFDREPHTTPYMTGTYFGKKKILNLEAGLIHHPSATWSTNGTDTTFHNMTHWSVAVYLDVPLNAEKGTAFSAYAGYFNLNYGPNYIRNNGIMNPANGVNANGTFSGAGNAFPMFGTGQVMYAQAGYLMKKNLLGKMGTLMPYASANYSVFQKLDDPMLLIDGGINWLVADHNQKVSLGLQNRPVFMTQTNGDVTQSSRRNSLILQYQVMF